MSYGVNLNQRAAGTKSIGAVATEKVQSDALNLGFPSAYQSVYAMKKIPERYFPLKEHLPMPMWAGTDLQSQYHEQKRQDADYMAGAKVRATQLSRMRYVGTPHGRGLLPDAVLAQRQFANPNNGALTNASGRQNHKNSPFPYADGADYTSQFVGGVLRSAQGQAHGIARLRDRVGQLNAIATAKADFASGTMPTSSGVSTQSVPPSAAGSPAIELNLLLQGIQDACVSGTGEMAAGGTKLDKFDLSSASRALGLIFRLAPEGDSDFLEDTQAKVQNILELLNGLLDPDMDSAGMTASAKETALSLQTIFTRLDVYLTRMIGGAPVVRQETRFNPLTGQQETTNILSQQQGENLSIPERVALSKNLVSSLGFSKMLKYAVNDNPSGLLSEAQRDNLFTAQQHQRYEQGDMDDDDDDDDDRFDRPEGPREDEAHETETGVSRSARDFDTDERQVFGFNSGMYYPRNGRGEDEYFGEAEANERQSTAPSTYLGRQSDQRRGHRNRETTSAPSDRVRGRFDPDTQGFNLDFGEAPPPTARRPAPPSGRVSVASPQPSPPPRKHKFQSANVNPHFSKQMERMRVAAANEQEGYSTTTSGAPTTARSTATRSVRGNTETGKQKHYNKLPTRFREQNEAVGKETFFLGPEGQVRRKLQLKKAATPAPPAFKAPTRQSELPTSREGFVELSRQLIAAGGPRIVVYAGSTVPNIRKNFIKRLDLAGKY